MMVFILKGNIGKSIIIEELNTIYSDCISYCDYTPYFSLPFTYINSLDYSLSDLFEAIKKYLIEYKQDSSHFLSYDYFFLYTNNTEEELKEIILWIKENAFIIPHRNVIVCCSE